MKGIESDLLKMSARALQSAYEQLSGTTCAFAIQSVGGGKADTCGLDSIPEEAIKQVVADYDSSVVLITEETGKMYSGETGLEPHQTVLICDPTDRSIKLKEFIESCIEQLQKNREKPIGEVLEKYRDEWERQLGPASISGASASITAIRDRRIVFNLMVNYVTGEMFVADSLGPRRLMISDDVLQPGTRILFSPNPPKLPMFATFLGKPGYDENLKQCALGLDTQKCRDRWVGGPLRILQLSNVSPDPVAFLLSNGEKVGEWIGWLAWVKYAIEPALGEYSLEAFRVFFESPLTRGLVSVAPGPHYSIFVVGEEEFRINLDRMFQLKDPSHYRETIFVVPRHDVPEIARIKSLGPYQERLGFHR